MMKHFMGVAVLVALALAVRLLLPPRHSVDIHVHGTYFVGPSIRIIGFWLLMGVAAVRFVIATFKFGRS
jgi:hypothetical protein